MAMPLIKSHIFEIRGLIVDTAIGRGDPIRIFSRLDDTAHQRLNIGAIRLCRQPIRDVRLPRFFVDDLSGRRNANAGERTDLAIKRFVRHAELKIDAVFFHHTIPARDANDGVGDIVVAQAFV